MGQGRTIGNLREIFEVQMQAQYFPVQLDRMGASFEFLHIDKASEHFTGVNNTITTVIANRHNHPGGAYGYRVERAGKVLVFCTDIEHGDTIDQNVVELARAADLLVHEAQYTTEELKTKKGWGHSSYDQVLQVAEMAGVQRLVITHHDPDHDDVSGGWKSCARRFPLAAGERGDGDRSGTAVAVGMPAEKAGGSVWESNPPSRGLARSPI